MVTYLRVLTASARFHAFILVLIVMAALVAGFETSASLVARFGPYFNIAGTIIQVVFMVEILLRTASNWPRPWKFFRDPWNVFDFVVAAGTLLPTVGRVGAVARIARLLRVGRLASSLGDLRLVVETMMRSLSQISNILILLGLLLYVYAVLGCHIFSGSGPQRWGSLASSAWTLVAGVLTLDWWVDIHAGVATATPGSHLFFASFIFVIVFIVMNLFDAVLVSNLVEANAERRVADRGTNIPANLAATIAGIRSSVDRLESALSNDADPGSP